MVELEVRMLQLPGRAVELYCEAGLAVYEYHVVSCSAGATGICLSLDPSTSNPQLLHLLALERHGEQELRTVAEALEAKAPIIIKSRAKISQLPRDLPIMTKVDVFQVVGDLVLPRPAQVLFLSPGRRSWRSPVMRSFLCSSM